MVLGIDGWLNIEESIRGLIHDLMGNVVCGFHCHCLWILAPLLPNSVYMYGRKNNSKALACDLMTFLLRR
jgi:hypothetical protein